MELENFDSSILIIKVSSHKDSTSWQKYHNLQSFCLPMFTKHGFAVPFLKDKSNSSFKYSLINCFGISCPVFSKYDLQCGKLYINTFFEKYKARLIYISVLLFAWNKMRNQKFYKSSFPQTTFPWSLSLQLSSSLRVLMIVLLHYILFAWSVLRWIVFQNLLVSSSFTSL